MPVKNRWEKTVQFIMNWGRETGIFIACLLMCTGGFQRQYNFRAEPYVEATLTDIPSGVQESFRRDWPRCEISRAESRYWPPSESRHYLISFVHDDVLMQVRYDQEGKLLSDARVATLQPSQAADPSPAKGD